MKKQLQLLSAAALMTLGAHAQTVSVDVTDRLLVNPDFELYEKDCTPVAFKGAEDVEAAAGLAFGWSQNPEEFDGDARGLVQTTKNYHGNALYYCSQATFPDEFKFYQRIPAAKLTPGLYKVSCLMWVEKDMYGSTCLYANKNVKYYTTAGYYKGKAIVDTDEERGFSDYAGGNPSARWMRPVFVYVQVGEGEDLEIGIRTSSFNNGANTKNAGTFSVDDFHIEKVLSQPGKTPTEFSAEVLQNNDFELNSEGEPFASVGKSTWWKWDDIAPNGGVFGWDTSTVTDNCGLTNGGGKAQNISGKLTYWVNAKGEPIPDDYTLSQMVSASDLEPGIYELSARIWSFTTQYGKGRLFADNGSETDVAYYGVESQYEGNVEEGEKATFFGYPGANTNGYRRHEEMFVNIPVDDNVDNVQVGIKSGAGVAAAAGHGVMHLDFVRFYKVSNLPMTLDADDNTGSSLSAKNDMRVTLKRRFDNKAWNTVCLPFALDAADITAIFGKGARVAAFTGVKGTDLLFTTVDKMEAGKPYIIQPTDVLPSPMIIDDVNITATEATSVEQGGYTLKGSFAPMAVSAADNTRLVLSTTADDNQLTVPSEDGTVAGFGAVVLNPAKTAGLRILIDGVATGITAPSITTAEGSANDRIYNLNGQRVEQLSRGVNIVNGKKIIKK